MPPAKETPIIIGVGDIKNRSTSLASAKEPATLILEAIQAAAADASVSSASKLVAEIDSISVVRTWTWPYPDLPGLLAQKLGVRESVKYKSYPEHGGDKPGKLFDEAAKRVARGECRVAVVTGGEALASRAYILSLFETSTCLFLVYLWKLMRCHSVCLCSSKETPSAGMDETISSCRLSLLTYGS